MSDTNWNIPFPVQNSQRRYPLSADATAMDVTGSFELPNDFIVGINFPIHAGTSIMTDSFFIKSIGSYDTGFAIVFGYNGSPVEEIATVWVPRQAHTRNKAYRIGGVGDFSDTIGTIVIGRFDDIDKQPAGSFNFDIAGSRLSTDVVRPVIRGVRSISITNGVETTTRFSGDIEFLPQENMQITAVTQSGGPTQIKFSAIEGAGLTAECQCDGDRTPPCIKRINGVGPTPDGDFVLLGDKCITVNAIESGLRFVDTCSSPCCGCDELEDVTAALQVLGAKTVSLESFTVKIDNSYAQFRDVVLASRLSDRGCDPCE